jgi:hypothetical protein
MVRFAIGIALGALYVGCGESTPPPAAASSAVVVASSPGNHAPVIESLRLEPAEPAQGATVSAVVMARDPDGQSVVLTHRWFVDGAEQQGVQGPTLALADAAKGAQIRVAVTASDGVMTSEMSEVSTRVIDRAPQITGAMIAPEKSVTPGQPVTASAGAGDPDGDALTFDYTWYVNGERRSETGSLFKTDGLKNGDTIYAEIRATDGSSWTDPLRTDAVTVGSAHPEIVSKPPSLREDGVFRYQVEAVDPDGDKRLRYSLEKAPPGMAIDNMLGDVVWKPADQKPGVFPVVVVVRLSGLETKQSFSVTVQQSEGKPAPTSLPAAPAAADEASAPNRSHGPLRNRERTPIEDRTH